MKKHLFIALAALGFAACAEKIDNKIPHSGEVEESYIAINLMSADIQTRAATDSYGYEIGTDAERAINKAYFFFFDEKGDPFNVTASAPGGEKNHMSLTISDATTSGMPNVSDIKNAVLVLNTYKGVYPSKIVAVLNWTPENKTYTLKNLHETLPAVGDDTNGYVMSNSVYMDGADNIVDAVPLTAANIKTTSDDALKTPIDIYVERTAAKVVLTASQKIQGTDMIIFDTQKNSTPIVSTGTSSETKVYVQIHGWELYNDYNASSLLKNIDTAWKPEDLGLTWNDIPYYRCYWAESQDADPKDSFSWKYEQDERNDDLVTYSGYPTSYGFAVAGVDDKYNTRSTYTYCGENTNNNNFRTKVILKGQLMQKKDGAYKPLELARWYGTEYAGNDALRIAVANSLKYTLYYKVEEKVDDNTVIKYVSIGKDDIQCVAGGNIPNVKAYEVIFQLSTTGKEKTWYQYSSEHGYVAFGDNGVPNDNAVKANAYLATVEPALLYTEGNTYYYVDIKHLGATGKTAEYGVVRNHVYQIDINSIKGYGSPVYNGFSNIETPDYPAESEASYVAARINVLSWKVVKQGVDIVQ